MKQRLYDFIPVKHLCVGCLLYTSNMPELITIEEAARITGFPSEDIQYWAKSHKICLLYTSFINTGPS